MLESRPNRFVMMVKDSRNALLKAHCPNPGKLTEFLVPGQPLLIERHTQSARTTDCTVAAVCYRGKIVFLYSAKANDIARSLVLPRLHPGRSVIPEWTIGRSRFDFLLEGSPNTLVEVKSCSLVEHTLAMFPDTPTERGSRHIDELISLTSQGYDAEILFVISHEDAREFMPNPHTDPLFCRNLHRARSYMNIQAVSVRTSPDGSVEEVNTDIPVETEFPALLADSNCGIYLLVMKLEKPLAVPVKTIGNPVLDPGWYLYVGSARKNLQQRTARHLRKKKKPHWHIDHLTRECTFLQAFPIRTFADLECSLADDIQSAAHSIIPRFGSSDCRCDAHLFFFQENPLHNQEVLDHLFRYRHVRFRES